MKQLDIQELEALAADIRAFLITSTSKSGGHIVLESGCGRTNHCVALYF